MREKSGGQDLFLDTSFVAARDVDLFLKQKSRDDFLLAWNFDQHDHSS